MVFIIEPETVYFKRNILANKMSFLDYLNGH